MRRILLEYLFTSKITLLICFTAYCRNWVELIDKVLAFSVQAKEIVEDYKAKLAAEEQLSRKTTKRK